MTPRPRLITQFSDARPFSEAANRWQYRHPAPRRWWQFWRAGLKGE